MTEPVRDAVSRDAAAVRTEYARRAHDPALRRYYERIAPALGRAVRGRRARMIAALDRLGPRDQLRILDLGCGDGADLAHLVQNGFTVSRLAGVDLLPGALADAKRRLPAAMLAAANGAELPFADAAFDATVQITALSSIVDPSVRERVATELARVTRPGGLILSHDMRVVVGRNPRLVAIDRSEIGRLFSRHGHVTVERDLLDVRIASRVPAWLARLLDRAPALRTHELAIVRRRDVAAAHDDLARTYRGYEDGHARRWSGQEAGARIATDERDRWLADAIAPMAGGLVLDIGSGDANLFRTLTARGTAVRYVGVELLPDRAREARALSPSVAIARGTAVRLPLADASVSTVVAATLLSSLREPWLRAAATAEIARVLRPGGRVVVYDLRYPSPRNDRVRRVSLPELRRLFPGWRVVSARTLTVLPPLARMAIFGGARRYAVLSRVPPLRSHIGVVLERPRS